MIFFLACEKNESTPDFKENIKIRMSENIDSVPRQLNFHCFTEKIFPCSNYYLQSSFSITSDKVTIHFIKVIEPGICLTSTGPASTIINLGNLQNKNYELEINVGNRKVSGELAVTSGYFKVTLPAQTSVEFIKPQLNRIPDNIIFGTVGYHSDTTGLIVQKFLDSLQYFGAVKANYTTGDYESFQIDSDGKIIQTQDPGYYFTRYFIYDYTKESGQLRDLVKRFGTTYPDLLVITLNTSKGEIFYSWTK